MDRVVTLVPGKNTMARMPMSMTTSIKIDKCTHTTLSRVG